jgi:hypothetical protein
MTPLYFDKGKRESKEDGEEKSLPDPNHRVIIHTHDTKRKKTARHFKCRLGIWSLIRGGTMPHVMTA